MVLGWSMPRTCNVLFDTKATHVFGDGVRVVYAEHPLTYSVMVLGWSMPRTCNVLFDTKATHVFGDGVWVVYAEHPFTHEHSPLLVGQGLHVVAHDVVEAREEPQAGRDLGVHGSVDVVQEVQGLADQLVPLP